MEKKSFTRQSVCFCVMFSLVCTGLLRGYVRDVPADPNTDPNTASAGVLTASLDNPNAAYLIFDAGDGSIIDAMQNIGALNVRVRSDSNPVTTQDWDWCDIVIIGANSGSDTITGLDTDDIESRITGRVILSGHDADLHASDSYSGDPQWAAQMFLIQSINYVFEGAGKGLIGFGDASAAFEWAPESWELACTKGLNEETVISFTEEGLASGIYNDLTPSLMSDWAVSYHVRFDRYSQGFFPFETGYFNGQEGTVTIGCPVNPMGVELYKYDDIADGNCVTVDSAIEYTIEWHNTTGQTFYDAYIRDVFPVGVDYPVSYTFDPNTFTMVSSDPGYDEATHTYIYPIGTLVPDDSDSIQLTVTVNENAAPGMYLHNTAELWATVYDANGLNPAERLLAAAYEDTLACCWDTNGILYVDQNAPAGGNGTSWELAYNDLEDALTRARETTCAEAFTIYVAQGPYSPGEYADDSFVLPEGVSVYGGFPTGGCEFSERNPKRYQTTLTGNIGQFLRNDTVVQMADNCLIDGFIISDAGEYCVYSSGVDFSLVQCTIEDSWQYGIRANDGNVDLSWCTVRNNLYHGILHSGAGYELNIDNCWFMKQKRIGINCEYSTPILKNSIVTESDLNETGNAGIFMLNPSSQPILQNCTISHNKSVGVSLVGNRMPSLINSIVYHNNGGGRQLSANLNPDVVAQYCCIADCNNVNNNINADPEFAYYDPNNVRIMSSSPCHDSGLTLSENYTQFDMDNRDRVLGTVVDRGAYEIECEDVANIYDWNADGLVNLVEFARFSRVWLAHDPNDPALNDPNHVDYEYLTDPNSPSYVTPSNIAAWYPDGHTFNFATVGASQHTIDIADLIFFLEDAPWLWRACWLTDGLLSEQSVAGGGTSVMLTDTKTMSLEAQVIEDKSAIEQAVDLVSIITQLEQLWKDEPDIQQEINAEDWNRFMESVYKSLSELEIDAAEAK